MTESDIVIRATNGNMNLPRTMTIKLSSYTVNFTSKRRESAGNRFVHEAGFEPLFFTICTYVENTCLWVHLESDCLFKPSRPLIIYDLGLHSKHIL